MPKVYSLEKGFRCTPKRKPNPAEVKQKEQYETGLQQRANSLGARQRFRPPWEYGEAMMPELLAKKAELQAVVSGIVIQLLISA